MINLKNTVIVVLTFIMVMLFSVTAMAATLNEATYDDSKITVSGSCTSGNKVQVVVFDYNNQPLYLSTIDVVGNSFGKTLDAIFNFEAGKAYTVRVADYNGKNASQKPLHTHSFASELKLDDTNHWLECSCGAKSDITAHTFSELKFDDANHWKECSCGAKSDITPHTFSEQKSDDTNHWLECSCGAKSDITAHTFSELKFDNTNHWLECSCGAKSDITAHTFSELKFDDANHWLECSCGAKSDITAHTFSELKFDDANHWLECSCGAKSDITAHTYGEWTVTKDATETENGSKECTCSVCGYKQTAVIEATGTSPNTSDNGNLMLWIALLIISGGILTTLCVVMKKRRKQQ